MEFVGRLPARFGDALPVSVVSLEPSRVGQAARAWDESVRPLIDIQDRLWSDRLDAEWPSFERILQRAALLHSKPVQRFAEVVFRSWGRPKVFAIYPDSKPTPKRGHRVPLAIVCLAVNCPDPIQKDKKAVFIDWLSSAPAAALTLLTAGVDKGAYMLGKAALDVAVVESHRAGSEGRVWLRAYFDGEQPALSRALMEWYRSCGMLNLHRRASLPPRYGYVTGWNNGRVWHFDPEASAKFSKTLDPFRRRSAVS